MKPRFTALKVTTLTITPPIQCSTSETTQKGQIRTFLPINYMMKYIPRRRYLKFQKKCFQKAFFKSLNWNRHNLMTLCYLNKVVPDYIKLWKEILKSDWWFKIPPISTKLTMTSTHRTKRWWHMTLVTQVLAWNRQKNVAVLNVGMGFHPTPLDNRLSNGKTDINKVHVYAIS